MAKPSKRLLATAYHEAGHAVAAHLLNRRIIEVSIVPDSESLGRIKNQPLKLDADVFMRTKERMQLEREAIIYLAGPVADSLFTGKDNRGGDGDRNLAVDCVLAIVGGDLEEAEPYLSWLWKRTIKIIKNEIHWAGVEALAKALLERKVIKGVTARKIIQEEIKRKMEEKLGISQGA